MHLSVRIFWHLETRMADKPAEYLCKKGEAEFISLPPFFNENLFRTNMNDTVIKATLVISLRYFFRKHYFKSIFRWV